MTTKKSKGKRSKEVHEPHSPFQKLIEATRLARGMAVRELWRAVNARAAVPLSTFWLWIHTVNGVPAPRTFKPKHMRALAAVLRIPEDNIKNAYDASRHHFTPTENPVPHASQDSLRDLEVILANDKRKSIPRQWMLNIVRRLMAGAEKPAHV